MEKKYRGGKKAFRRNEYDELVRSHNSSKVAKKFSGKFSQFKEAGSLRASLQEPISNQQSPKAGIISNESTANSCFLP